MGPLNAAVFFAALIAGLLQQWLVRDHDLKGASAVQRWWTNGVLYAACTATVTLAAAALAWLTSSAAHGPAGPVSIGQLPLAAQIALLLIVHSFVQYWQHRAMHQVPALWALHRVHHADTTLDATSGLRHHPVEAIISYLVLIGTAALLRPSAEGVLGYILLSMAFAMFTHMSPGLLPALMDRALSRLLVTPRLHQLHHSNRQPETDSNYGEVLIVWDRLFATCLDTPVVPRAGFAVGLEEFPPALAQDPIRQLASPLQPRRPRGPAQPLDRDCT
jgi:sterol desaturase/sphingolipid hydroxylase (fatty acid hydroxylase superfamily)